MQFHLNGFRPGDPDIFDASDAVPVVADGLPQKVDVLIAGCGPAGLCLAAQLSMVPEISTMIVEPKDGPMEKGQADGINVRSMEMFQAFGFAEKIKRESVWINETTFWTPDPDHPETIRRVGRVQDVADDLSEMPHVLINQARVHDMYLDIMRNSPTRLEPHYELKVVDAKVSDKGEDYPVTVTLEHMAPHKAGHQETVQARYVVGCDGARSNVRQAMGGTLHGDAAHQAWGVMDVLVVTDFPDVRMKSIVRSSKDGSIMILPREGGYLVRFYVEMDKLDETERVADRGLGVDDIIAKAKRILAPHTFDVKETVWWSIYEIGHRITDKFDDVSADQAQARAPHIFTAGDACHTHSPKAGQGMNVSMGDTFNLGWKLISVLTGRAAPDLLHSYSAERRAAAQALIDFDHRWSRTVSAAHDDPNDTSENMPAFQRQFIDGGEFTAGLTVKYEPSNLIGPNTHQGLAKGLLIGKRFHSAPVIRLADAKPMQLGHAIQAGIRWTVFAFSPKDHSAVFDLSKTLETDVGSPINRFRREGDDIDALIDFRAVFQQGFRDLAYETMPALLRPEKGVYGLTDYEKVFCVDQKASVDIFDMRGIDRQTGCMVVVRPDQYVAHILPLEAHDALGAFFEGIFAD